MASPLVWIKLSPLVMLFCACFLHTSWVVGSCRSICFGEKDQQYRCHCRLWPLCDELKGTCGSGRCANGYAGTACQYTNLAFRQGVGANFSVTLSNRSAALATAVDGDVKSYFLEDGHQNLPFTVHVRQPSWVHSVVVRLVGFNGTTDVTELEVTIHNGKDSLELDAHLAESGDEEVTYHLQEPTAVDRVQIRALGDLPLALREVSVLSGRNLAVGKEARQGDETQKDNTAERSVDGETYQDLKRGSCSHTKWGWYRHSWWTVALGDNLNIWRLRIYNRDDYEPERLDYFRVNVSLSNGSEVQVYEHDGQETPDVEDIHLTPPLPVTSVTIWLEGTETILQLCEVEVYGDCLDGYFGWHCQKTCQCQNPDEICDKIWGFCPHSKCLAGYRGDGCQQECHNGSYGFQCSGTCSTACVNSTCHHVTGNCTYGCLPGWEGPLCNESCDQGWYGHECSSPCPANCRFDHCHLTSGECTHGCSPGWTGYLCDEPCANGTYGNNCSLNCSSGCVNNSCDAVSGVCSTGCREGMMGNYCAEREKSFTAEDISDEEPGETNWVLIGCILGGLLLLALAFFAFVVKKQRSRTSKAVAAPAARKKMKDETVDGSDVMILNSLYVQSVDDDSVGYIPMSSPTSTTSDHKSDPTAGEYCTVDGLQNAAPKKPENQSPENPPASPPNGHRDDTSRQNSAEGKPQLMSLFSRDASLEGSASPDPPDQSGKHSSPSPAEKAPPIFAVAKGDYSPVISGPRTSSLSKKGDGRGSGFMALEKRGASFESLEVLSVDSMDIGLPATPPKTRRTRDGDYYNVVCRDASPTTAIPVNELPERITAWLENPRHFNRERLMLPEGKVSDWKIALLPQNIRKNRYRDIYPYDHSRVLLDPLPDDPFSDFYNACYVDGYEREKEYIAAQGPMERTVADFLRMVWDLRCSRVVMLTKTVEMGRFKSQQYWPEGDETLMAGEISVVLNCTTNFADFCIRYLTLKRNGESRPVSMFHYWSWPDNLAPSSPWSLLDFRHKVRHADPRPHNEGPAIVHCSAGIGRTGTYLALDILLARAVHEDKVDVFTCVWNLRQQRTSMVQTLAQYIFIHQTLLASVMTTPPVPIESFDPDRFFSDKKGASHIATEFADLQTCLGPTSEDEATGKTPPEMSGIPRHSYRVSILAADGTFSPGYINAVYLPSYRLPRAYIQTHTPSHPEAAVDFLSMLVQHKVTVIVSLDPDQVGTRPYYPEADKTFTQIGPYVVTLTSIRRKRRWTVRKLRVSLPGPTYSNGEEVAHSVKEQQEVTHFRYHSWPPNRLTPLAVSTFLDLLNAVTYNLDSQLVVTHCRDGHTRSGLFTAAAVILERMRVEGHVAVNYVTAHMRVPRRENIVHLEQYKFLYACVQNQLDHDRGIAKGEDSIDLELSTTEDSVYGNLNSSQDHAQEKVYGNVDSVSGAGESPDVNSTPQPDVDEKDDSVYVPMTKQSSDNGELGHVKEPAADENLYGNVDGDADRPTERGGRTPPISGGVDGDEQVLSDSKTESVYSNT